MTRQQLKELRFKNFDELIARYGGSPKRFCEETGYENPTVISQLKGRARSFGSDLARQIAEAAGLHPHALENPDGIDAAPVVRAKPPKDWPFPVSFEQFMALSPKKRREIGESFADMVIGAQAQQIVNKRKQQG